MRLAEDAGILEDRAARPDEPVADLPHAADAADGNPSSAFGKCVSKLAGAQTQNENSASTTCRAEQDASAATFAQTYGSNNDAFGKCVSSKASAAAQSQQQATLTAAKACTTEKNANVAAFNSKYGTFGHCVSKLAKSQ